MSKTRSRASDASDAVSTAFDWSEAQTTLYFVHRVVTLSSGGEACWSHCLEAKLKKAWTRSVAAAWMRQGGALGDIIKVRKREQDVQDDPAGQFPLTSEQLWALPVELHRGDDRTVTCSTSKTSAWGESSSSALSV